MNFSRDLSLDDTLRDSSRRWRKFVYARKLRASWSMEEQEEKRRLPYIAVRFFYEYASR